MIQRFLGALAAAKLDLSAEDAADALWLALHLETLAPKGETQEGEPEKTTKSAHQSERDPREGKGPIKTTEATPANDSARVHLPSTASTEAGVSRRHGRTVESPGVPALPDALGISRALRPLQRRGPSLSRFVLDEEATVMRIAEGGPRVPVLIPSSERWLDLALVVDRSPTMIIWQQTIAELRLLLERQGAFRDIRTWALTAEE